MWINIFYVFFSGRKPEKIRDIWRPGCKLEQCLWSEFMGFRIDTPKSGDGLRCFWGTRRNVEGGGGVFLHFFFNWKGGWKTNFYSPFLKNLNTFLKKVFKKKKKKKPTESAAFIFPKFTHRSSEECSVTYIECARTHKGSWLSQL